MIDVTESLIGEYQRFPRWPESGPLPPGFQQADIVGPGCQRGDFPRPSQNSILNHKLDISDTTFPCLRSKFSASLLSSEARIFSASGKLLRAVFRFPVLAQHVGAHLHHSPGQRLVPGHHACPHQGLVLPGPGAVQLVGLEPLSEVTSRPDSPLGRRRISTSYRMPEGVRVLSRCTIRCPSRA